MNNKNILFQEYIEAQEDDYYIYEKGKNKYSLYKKEFIECNSEEEFEEDFDFEVFDYEDIYTESGKLIADDILDITDLYVQEITDTRIIFCITFKWNKKDKDFELELETDWKVTRLYHFDLLVDIIRKSKKIKSKKEFSILLRRYILYIFERYTVFKTKIGWSYVDDEAEYIPISSNGLWEEYGEIDVLHSAINACRKKYGNIKDTKLEVLDILNLKPCLYLFSYTLLSIIEFINISINKKLEINPFSVCVYGSDIGKVKMFVNLFSNFLPIDKKHIDKIPSIISFSASSLEQKRGWHIDYSPVVITTKNNRFNRSSSIVKFVHRQRVAKKLTYYPIYVSLNPINADEVIDINIDEVASLMTYNNIWRWKKQINILLISYIEEVVRLNNHANTSDYDKKWIEWVDKVKEIEGDSEEKYKNKLVIAILLFNMFLVNKCNKLRQAETLYSTACNLFLHNKDVQKKQLKQAEGIVKIFAYYVSYIEHKRRKPYIFYVANESKSMKNSECYYLEFSKFYDDFCKYAKREYGVTIADRALKRELKAKKLLFMRKNGQQYGVERYYKDKDKKISFLIVYKEKLMKYIEKN